MQFLAILTVLVFGVSSVLERAGDLAQDTGQGAQQTSDAAIKLALVAGALYFGWKKLRDA